MAAKDDPAFAEIMEAMGVRPLGGSKPRGGESSEPLPSSRDEAAQFLDAVQHLSSVPCKDEQDPEPHERFRKVKANKRKLQVDEFLDLHGKTVSEALDLLSHFITRAFAQSTKRVIVITGKGKHSPTGTAVLRPAVEQWIRTKGRRFIRSYAEAARASGGKGAFVVNLRDE